MSELNYIVTADNKGFVETMKDTKAQMRETARDIEKSGMSIEDAFERIKKTATGALAGFTVKEFVSKVAQVRGEFQQLEVAFTTMLGSAEKANDLMQQLTRTAASTPFDLQGVANGAKQLLAYGVAADKVNDTLVHLGDIAAGLSIPLNDLVMLYGTTMTQGRMFTQDLRQFMGRGIPLADELAKQFGVTKDKVGELVTAGKVGAEEFNRAIMSMSSEGGRFAGLMDAQSKTIAGQISNIEDAIDMMFNEIGQKNEGLINDVLGGVSYLVENYEKVGQAILTVALAYGEWKAAEMLLAATTSAVAKQRAAIDAERVSGLSAIATEYNAVIAAEESEAAAETANTAAKGANVSAIDAEIASLGNLLTARLTEAEAALAAAEQESILAQNRLREAQLSTAAYEQQYQAVLLLGDGEKIEAAENALNTAASNENAAAKAAQSAQDNVAAASKAKEAAATQLATFQTKVDTVNKQANTAATGLWAAATRSVTAALHSMKAAMASNPFGLVLVAITSIISLLTLFRKETEESTEALDKLRDAALGSTQKLATYRAVLENVDKKSAQYKKTIQDLNAMADEYHTTLFTEKDTVDELSIKYNELTDAIRANAAERILSEAASKATKDAMEAEKNAMTELMEDAADATYHKMEEVTENVDGVWINVWKAVEKESFNIRNVTSATWNQISAIVMENARKMSDAFEESPEKGKAAVNKMVSQIEGILKSLGVTDKEIEEFHDSLYEYVESSAKGFKDAYNELGRTEAQLRGIANAAKDTKDITNDAIDKMNYEQLQEQLKKVQKEIDEINAKPIKVDTDNTRLITLRNLLQEINDLLPTQLTVGSDAELEKRLKDAREQRDKQVYGSEEWKKYNNQVNQLNTTLTTHKKSYAENSARSSKDASTAAREKAKLQKEQQEYLELIEKQKQERERAVQDMQFSTRQAEIDALSEGSEKTLAQLSLDFEKQRMEIERGYEDLKQKKIEAARELWEANPANKDKVFDPSTVNTDYTAAETANYQAQIEANIAEFARAVADMDLPTLPESYIQDRIAQIREAYQQARQAIEEEEAKLRESQQGSLSSDQIEEFARRYEEVQRTMSEGVRALEQAEVERGKKKYQQLLNEYKSYDQKRRELEEKYQRDMNVYNTQRQRIVASGGNTNEIDQSIAARTKQYRKDIQDLQNDILEASDFYTKLFGDVSKKGYKVLRDFYKQAKETIDNAKVLSDGVEIQILTKDENGNFAKKAVKVTVEEFQKMKDRLEDILHEVEKDNPFAAFKTSWEELGEAVKSDGDVAGSLKNLNAKGKELTSTIKGWGDSLGAVFGKNFSQSIDEMMQMVDGVMDMGTGIAQIYSGDIVGGISNTLSGLSSIVSLFTSWKEKMEEMKRQWYLAEIETERILQEQNEEYAGMRSTITDIIKGTEQLNWLIEHGLAKSESVSLWRTQNDQLQEYLKNMGVAEGRVDELWGHVMNSRGYYEWGNSLNGGSVEWSLNGTSEAEMELLYQQDKLSDAARDYYEAWKETKGTVEELRGKMEELYASMREEIMGVNFDSFLSSVKDNLIAAKGDVSEFAKFTQETIRNALVNKFMYTVLADMFEENYNDLSKALISGLDHDNNPIPEDKMGEWLENWANEFNNEMTQATGMLEKLGQDMGVNLFEEADDTEAKEYFESLRDMWLSTLTDMETDAEEWGREITRVMVEDLINSLVLGNGFNDWLDDWKKRYEEAMSIEYQEERERRLIALREEQIKKREELAQKSQQIMDDMGYTDMMKDLEKSEDVFEDLHSNFLETLMDMNADAEEWSKQITETMVRQLIERNILNKAFDEQLDDWRSRFEDIMADTTLSDTEREASLAALRAELEALRESLSAEAQKYLDSLGYSDMIADKEESPFKDLRKSFLSTLTDMEGDAEGFRKDLQKILTQSLIEKFVLNDDFDKYLEEWNERYMAILNDGNKSQEEIEAALDAMIEELVQKREMTLEQAEKLRERLKEEDTTFKDMKENWTSALLDMEMTAESFAESLRQIMAEKIINQFLLGSSFQRFLDRYQDTVNTIMDGEGTMDEKIAALLPMVDEWVAKYEELAPLAERIREAFGIVPNEFASAFGDLRNTFVSALMDMESDADSFVQNISKIMSQAFIDKFVLGEQFDRQMKEWQERYASIVNGEMSEEERARQLKQLADAIAAAKEGYTEQAKAIQDLFGLTVYEDQEATMNTSKKATYDQFETFLGIAVAQQMATLQGNEVRLQILATLQAMSGITTPGSDTVKEIRTMLNTTNEYLLAIKKAAEGMYKDFGLKLDTLNSRITELI